MLKKFFISMLGTMAGIWVSLLLLIFAGIMFAGAMLSSSSETTVSIQKNSILHFKLNGEVADRYQPASFISLIQMEESNTPTLEEMLTSLRLAASDKNIKGLYLEFNGSTMGTASREELLEGIAEFKKSGKWVYAYSD
ncbi:MAG: hypothetical protein J6J93_09670, partial [Muribaculaceae bacterium]|nr:hypothetical protein [Muribaculaceae bacterium]